MKAYLVYSEKPCDAVFPHCVIRSAVVIAEDEKSAISCAIKNHSDEFVCNNNELLIELISDDLTKPTIVSVDFCTEVI